MTQPNTSPTLDTLFQRTLARKGELLALVDPANKARITGQPPKRLSYAEADRAISALAAHFVDSGLPAHSVIAVLHLRHSNFRLFRPGYISSM